MSPLPTLRREVITALAVVFAGALLMAATGVIMLLPGFTNPAEAVLYLTLLLGADVAIFAAFGRAYVQRRVVAPLEAMITEIEAIAAGGYARRLPPGGTAELARLGEAVNRMAENLIRHQHELGANIRSLDDTNRQLIEARDELVRAEKMVSVGRLSAGIAHEIGNPLGAIVGYLGVMRRGADDTRREMIGAAEREAKRIDRIIRGLLDYARPRDVRPQEISVNEVVQQTLDLLSTQGQFGTVQVSVDLSAEVPPIYADPYQLQQVLVNLLINAKDALDDTPDAHIAVRTELTEYHPRRVLPARRQDDPPDLDYTHRRRLFVAGRFPREDPVPSGREVVEIVVTDNGPGIPAELVEQIFEPFVTTKEPGKGTGLGLAVAARLVDSMGGTIRVDSPSGQGATFTVLVPATAELTLHGVES